MSINVIDKRRNIYITACIVGPMHPEQGCMKSFMSACTSTTGRRYNITIVTRSVCLAVDHDNQLIFSVCLSSSPVPREKHAFLGTQIPEGGEAVCEDSIFCYEKLSSCLDRVILSLMLLAPCVCFASFRLGLEPARRRGERDRLNA